MPGYFAAPLRLHPDIRLFPGIPDVRSSTAETRVLLPDRSATRQPASTSAGLLCWFFALTERPDLLMAATEDLLHQPQRAPAMPASGSTCTFCVVMGVAAVLSGAGPSVLALTDGGDLPAVAVEFGREHGFAVREVAVGDPVSWAAGIGVVAMTTC